MTTIASARIRALSIISITIVVVLLLLSSASQASLEVEQPFRTESRVATRSGRSRRTMVRLIVIAERSLR